MAAILDLTNKDAIINAIGGGSFFGVDELASIIKIVVGAGTPTSTSTIPEFIGQVYLDTVAGAFYRGKGTSSTADFILDALADLSASTSIIANGDTLAVTEALHANKVISFGKASGTIATLPASRGSGLPYTFVISTTATTNANIIKVANATDVMRGSLNIQQDTDAAGTQKTWLAGANDDTMSFAGAATSGGIIGGMIRCIDYAPGFWSCQAFTASGGGSEATPFSSGVN